MKFQNSNNRTDYIKKKLNNEKDRIDNGFHKGPKKTFCTIIKDKIPSKETRSSRRDWNSTFSDNKTFIQNWALYVALIHLFFKNCQNMMTCFCQLFFFLNWQWQNSHNKCIIVVVFFNCMLFRSIQQQFWTMINKGQLFKKNRGRTLINQNLHY